MTRAWWYRAWRALRASHGEADPEPPAPAIPPPLWPDGPLPVEERHRLARAARRARWIKATAHLIRQESDIAANEARVAEATSRDCLLWKFAYQRRSDEAAALRSALKLLLEHLPENC